MIDELTEKSQEQGFETKMKELNKLMGQVIQACDNNNMRKALVDDIIYAITFNHIEMDSHSDLLAFTNAVYDLDIAQWIQPHYKQYVSMTTGWNWNRAGADHTRLNKLLDQIFPNPKIKDHYLTILATGLRGVQIEKIFNATGKGGNGKGVLNALMLHAIGDYGYVLPSSVLISEIKEGPNPTIANLHKKRFAITSEPDPKKTINSSTAKSLTGEKKINCRGLYSSNCITLLMLTLIIECNKQPNFDEVNDAIARRLDVTPFVASFKDKHLYDDAIAGKTAEEIKKMNIYVSDLYFKSEQFQNDNRQALIEILFTYFEKYRKNGYQFVDIPEECKEASNKYMKKSDNIYNWFSENYKEDANSVIMVKNAYNAFKESELYMTMSKQEKRANNLHNFTEEIKENMFIGKYFKPADTYHNKIKYKSAYIVGFAERPRESCNDNIMTSANDDGFNAEEKE
jgi:phage/plasmid-associated DNA primase